MSLAETRKRKWNHTTCIPLMIRENKIGVISLGTVEINVRVTCSITEQFYPLTSGEKVIDELR